MLTDTHSFDFGKQKKLGGLKMDSQDKFFKESIKQIHEKRDAKEENFEMLQQQERAKVVDLRKR